MEFKTDLFEHRINLSDILVFTNIWVFKKFWWNFIVNRFSIIRKKYTFILPYVIPETIRFFLRYFKSFGWVRVRKCRKLLGISKNFLTCPGNQVTIFPFSTTLWYLVSRMFLKFSFHSTESILFGIDRKLDKIPNHWTSPNFPFEVPHLPDSRVWSKYRWFLTPSYL